MKTKNKQQTNKLTKEKETQWKFSVFLDSIIIRNTQWEKGTELFFFTKKALILLQFASIQFC